MYITKDDTVVTAWGELFNDGHFRNRLIWVLVRDSNFKYRVESLQPEEQSLILSKLIGTSHELTKLLVKEVDAVVKEFHNKE